MLLARHSRSGCTPSRWWANNQPVRPNPVCTSSRISSDPLAWHSVLHGAANSPSCGGMHAAFALHDFEDHGGGVRRRALLPAIYDVVIGDVSHRREQQRRKRIAVGFLPGQAERAQRPAVEAAHRGDKSAAPGADRRRS